MSSSFAERSDDCVEAPISKIIVQFHDFVMNNGRLKISEITSTVAISYIIFILI